MYVFGGREAEAHGLVAGKGTQVQVGAGMALERSIRIGSVEYKKNETCDDGT